MDGDDRGGLSTDVGGVAAAGVVGTVGGHCADLFAHGDVVQQFRQNWADTITAGGKLRRPDLGRVHGQMHFAPLATSLNTVFAHLPFAITEKVIPVLSNNRFEGSLVRR